MRIAQKQQAEELVKQIEEAHNQVRNYIEQKNIQLAAALLEDCQNGGIAMGTLIEETEGENHPTVAVLEDYCETIYRVHKELAEKSEISAAKIQKLLRQKLIKVENSLKNDVVIRREVVFLPYKASMWDSLESVWKAADADPECDAYVIPIPYYDKNPDGSFREVHYEGGLYPDYVPITKYDAYDFENRKPDMIYIHNPYDERNLVTSVHPFFYSPNLKRLTNKLVYISYYILGEIEPDNEEAVKGMGRFCAVPAVVNADKVIVQSEKMRQIYINVMSETMGEDTRKIWEEKILGLGSPKVDKVLDTRKESLKVPDEWLKVIEKPDGSWKKIVFYNTSVSGLLVHDEKMLQKILSVLEIFKKNQDEMTLLWRPHPLIQATIESMRPQLWNMYKEIVERYREEGWGIYDESADMDRAVALSDAYYGDASSVVQLYRKTGKMIMMQNIERNSQ